jgi:hypothetical protein
MNRWDWFTLVAALILLVLFAWVGHSPNPEVFPYLPQVVNDR